MDDTSANIYIEDNKAFVETEIIAKTSNEHTIKDLVDELLEDCNISDKDSIVEKVDKIVKIVDELREMHDRPQNVESKENLLNRLIKVDKKFLLECGHDQSDNDKLIQEFFDYCMTKKERPEFMIVVAVLLPDLIDKSYKRTVTNLIMQLTYVKVPSEWCKKDGHKHSNQFIQFNSSRKNLFGYKFPDHETPLYKLPFPFTFITFFSFFSETIPPHSATLCYVPLPGLCTYPKCSSVLNILFPHRLSSFAKLIISNPSDIIDTSHTSSRIYGVAPIQAMIKFKWHAFAWWRFFGAFFLYLSHCFLYSIAIFKTNKTTEGRGLMIASITLGAILIINLIRYIIISVIKKISIIYTITYVLSHSDIALAISTIAGFLFLYNDTSNIFLTFQAISIFLLWIGFIGYLCVFKKLGIFIIVIKHICRKILWPLVLLVIVLLAVAHSLVIYLDPKFTGVDESLRYNGREMFAAVYKSFINVWDAFLNDYGFLDQLKDNYFINILKIIFSLFTSIIILNLLIAIVSNVYEKVFDRAHAEWTMVRARFIVYIELLLMFPKERRNSDYFPSTITYEAFTEHVDKWPKKLKENDIPILWEDENKIEKKVEMIEKMIKKMTAELEKLRKQQLKDSSQSKKAIL